MNDKPGDLFQRFLDRNAAEFARDANGDLARRTGAFDPVASEAIARSLQEIAGLRDVPDVEPRATLDRRLGNWLLQASQEDRKRAGLDIPKPPSDVHFVPGALDIFYDFRNTDIALHELTAAGAQVGGKLLDFGSSSGRNLAVLRRAFGDRLQLFGADPAAPSVRWLKENVAGVEAIISNPNPPLPWADDTFDLIIAKSIWTHFSPKAATDWLAEMNRILRPGGHLMFSTHGPHDIAYRLTYDIPPPAYDRFGGNPHWTRDAFLADTIGNLETSGFYFQPYRQTGPQAGPDDVVADWGLAFVTEAFVRDTLLPAGLTIARRSIGRTGNRHDVYVVRKNDRA
jgi:SAM-dependent methyltransferase